MVRTQLHRSVVFLSVLALLVGAVYSSLPAMAMGTMDGGAVQTNAAPAKMPMRAPCPRGIVAPCCVGVCVSCAQMVGLPSLPMGLGAPFAIYRAPILHPDGLLGVSALPDPAPPRTFSIV
ncbi:MAG: hypothetical protein HQ512_06035 [Rhodospirillales bacterium]|nr:hypothetical protein [Rhodospirillales bacterium]